MNWKNIALAAAFASVISFSMAGVADAARMGGGRSFGRSPSVSRPVAPPAAPMQRQTAPGAGVGAAASPGFGFGGGMLGGFLAGSMIGSLLGGRSTATAADGQSQTSSGPGLLDIVVIGGIIYLGFRLLRRRPAPAGYQQSRTQYSETPGNAWENLSSRPASFQNQSSQAATAPAGFDAEEFLKGAKMAYVRLQESWDRRDLDDIAQFVGPEVLAELKQQAADDPTPSHTELMLVNAELMGVESTGGEQTANVLFDVLMQEQSTRQEPQQVREVWIFAQSGNNSWRLDGIQQV